MKRITKIILLLILLSVIKVNGQNDIFNPNHFLEITNSANYSASTTYDFHNSQPKVFNVYFYFLDLTTGGGYISGFFNEDYALKSIADLNIAFNQFNIFFKYRGNQVYSEIYNGSELTNQYENDIIDRMYEVAQQEGTDNNINIVYNHTMCQPYIGGANIYKKMISLRYCHAETNYLIYQMGHIFGLLKTHQNTDKRTSGIYTDNYCDDTLSGFYATPLNGPVFYDNSNEENVTRDINNVNYNADIAGDMVTDTPACFKGSEDNYCQFSGTNSSDYTTYEYISHPLMIDNSTEHLMYENVDVLNFMSYHHGYASLRHFTNGQGVRMRETIAIPALNFDDVSTTLASLYEPYKCIYTTTVSENISSLTDNGNGTAEECRWSDGTYFNYFQPGFDYEFGFMSSNLDFSFSKDDLPFALDQGNYRVLKINQINPLFLDENDFTIEEYDTLTNLSIGNAKFSNAYHNSWESCETVPFTKVKIISKDNLGSPYSQLLEFNTQQGASNPSLEQNLENNKIHFIEKTTTTGNKIQKTIYKNGN